MWQPSSGLSSPRPVSRRARSASCGPTTGSSRSSRSRLRATPSSRTPTRGRAPSRSGCARRCRRWPTWWCTRSRDDVKLCMFHPLEHPMERGWVGRIDGDQVIQLAAQTLQSFFTGGGSAREHAVFPLAAVRLLAPVLHPPSVRVFEDATTFAFANPASIQGHQSEVTHRTVDDWLPLEIRPRLAAVVGVGGSIAGLTLFADWRAPDLSPPKDRDFAIGLGPVVVTLDEAPRSPEVAVRVLGEESLRGRFDPFDWAAAHDLAADGPTLVPGDLIAGPALGAVGGIEPEALDELDVEGIGTLAQGVRPEVELR